MALHNQLLINGYSDTPPTDEAFIKQWMENLVLEIDMKIIQGPYTAYVTKEGNRGLTAIVMIETSHIALHVWDEDNPGMIQFDLYTCSTLPVQDVIDNLKLNLGLKDYSYMVIERENGFDIKEKCC
jgi:S-adenosylmethionine/arginine decarboxylase-like enzyme